MEPGTRSPDGAPNDDGPEAIAALRRSEQRLLQAQHNAGVGIWERDVVSGWSWWSPESRRLYGVADDVPASGDEWKRRVHPDDLPRIEAVRAEQIARDERFEIEYRIRLDGGGERWLLTRGSAVHDADGRVRRLSGINLDITSRKQAEALAEARRAQLQVLYDAARSLSGTLDLLQVYRVIHERVSTVAASDAFSIAAYDPATRLITCRAYHIDGRWHDAAGFPAIPLEDEGRGVQSRVIRSGQPLLVDDYQAAVHHAASNHLIDGATGAVLAEAPSDADITRSALVVPLKTQGAVTGVIHSPSARRDVDEAMRAAGAFGITLGAVDIGSYRSTRAALASFAHARALLLFKDPPLLEQAPLDTLLLLAYDMRGMGVVGYASGVVDNGALATTYASLDDTVRSLATLITEIHTTGVVPAAAHTRYYSVSVNRYVMRSLGIRERDAGEIKMSVDALLAGDAK